MRLLKMQVRCNLAKIICFIIPLTVSQLILSCIQGLQKHHVQIKEENNVSTHHMKELKSLAMNQQQLAEVIRISFQNL